MKGDKKVRIVAKIVEDKNGKREEFDTTINLDRNMKPGEAEDIMKDFKMRMRDLDEQMKELEADFNEMNFPDSGKMDSAQKHIERTFSDWSGFGNSHFRHNFNPREFNFDYNFDFPDPGEIPQRFLREFRNENDRSLNDILGDIPMDQVKSYSIQDTKDGKRIVIELNKEPFTGHHREVIILRSPPPERMFKRDYNRPRMKKKVIINNGDEEGDEN
jgi:hypothetical protein